MTARPGTFRARSRFLLVKLGAGALVALALGVQLAEARPRGKVVGDVVGLEKIRLSEIDEAYARPGVDVSRFARIWLEPVEILEGQDPRLTRIPQGELDLMTRYFEERIEKELEDYPRSEEMGYDVVRIQPYITGLAYNRPKFDYDRPGGLDAGPPARTSQQPKEIFAKVVGVGEAWIQVEFRDSQTGELLLVIADAFRGRDLQFNYNRDYTWGDAQEAFRMWARLLRRNLDRIERVEP